MKILFVSATQSEIASLLKKRRKISEKQKISSYRFGKHSLDVLITGAGMTSTAFYLGKILSDKYDLAINAGIAGSFSKSIPIGSVVNVASDCFADFGAENGVKFLSAEEIGLVAGYRLQPTYYKFRSKIVDSLPKVKAITVNTVHGNPASIKKIIEKFNPDIESMEGAAFFFSCNHEKIPCVQIRAISNYVERRNKNNWRTKLAAENLSVMLEKILSNL